MAGMWYEMFCYRCGGELNDGEIFCSQRGTNAEKMRGKNISTHTVAHKCHYANRMETHLPLPLPSLRLSPLILNYVSILVCVVTLMGHRRLVRSTVAHKCHLTETRMETQFKIKGEGRGEGDAFPF